MGYARFTKLIDLHERKLHNSTGDIKEELDKSRLSIQDWRGVCVCVRKREGVVMVLCYRRVAKGGYLMSCSISLHLIILRQSLSH